ncbi:MAG: DNA repair protein RecN [Alistipes sp.]|nr:DNA repair protein RecN [Alistipes sp.]
MLSRLTVENYALIEHLELALDAHLNIVTGETGAGKSILLGALGLLLGAKNDGSAMKDNTRNCVVEGHFLLKGLGLEPLFEELDIDYEDETIIRRIITPAGKSRSYVNDIPVQLAQLKELGARLIDIHSQHQNLILSSESFRMQAVDVVAGSEELLARYREEYRLWCDARKQLAALVEEAAAARRDEEWVRFQAEELRAANLKENEIEELEQEQAVLANADAIGSTLGEISALLEEEEVGVLSALKRSETGLLHIKDSYREGNELATRVRSVLLELKDVAATVASDAERVESNPERLEQVDNRLSVLYNLCRKHGVESVGELILQRDKFCAQLNAITRSDEQIATLETEVSRLQLRCAALADKLHDAREGAVATFAQEIGERLALLGMPDAQFEVEVRGGEELKPMGRDEVIFLFTANRSKSLQPVERIASGGEMSRMMLSLKALLAGRMKLPTIIFDEIDTGVSGRIADAMGEIIAELAQRMQVVNITHLPQVASKGEAHFVVYKENAHTNIKRLSAEERVVEIAKMLSGSAVSEAALSQAQILLGAR